MRTLDFIAIMTIDIIIYAGVPVLVMWVVGRFLRRRIAMAVGFLAIAFDVYMIVGLYNDCNAPPICPDGPGPCHFLCDAPYAGIFDIFIRYGGPISVALLLAAIFFQYRQFRWQKQF